jgi:hypothetical protein
MEKSTLERDTCRIRLGRHRIANEPEILRHAWRAIREEKRRREQERERERARARERPSASWCHNRRRRASDGCVRACAVRVCMGAQTRAKGETWGKKGGRENAGRGGESGETRVGRGGRREGGESTIGAIDRAIIEEAPGGQQQHTVKQMEDF